MKQIRQALITWPGGSNTAIYFHPLSPCADGWSTTAAGATAIAPAAGTLRNLCVEQRAAVDAGDVVTIRFDKGGVATALSVSVTGPALTGSDTSNSVHLNAGDTFVIVNARSGLPIAGTAMVSYEWEPDDGVTSIYGFGGQQDTISTGTHRDGLLDGGGGVNGWDGTADQCKTLIACPGNVTRYDVSLSTAPGSGNSRTFTGYLNGVAQDGAGATVDTRITISDTATTGTASFTLPIASGNFVYVQTSHTGTPASTRAIGSVAFVATNAGDWHVGANTDTAYSSSATVYAHPSGASGVTATNWNATESGREFIAGVSPYSLRGMIGALMVAPGGVASAAFTLRKDQAATTQAITFTGAAVTATTAGAAVFFASQSERLSLQAVPTGTPTVANSSPKVAWIGSNTLPPITGSAVFGVKTTVTATRAIAFGLDDATNVHDEAGKFKVFGDMEVTGALTAGSITSGTVALGELSDVVIS